MPKISIIIPVYNGEKYIGRCLDSVLNQTFDDVEVLAINDGSKDGSLDVLKDYEGKYPEKIKVLTQENQGVAKTRNRGIELTKTKYLMFIDQDDWIDPDYCETHYKVAEEGDYDIVLSGFKRPGAGGRIINKNVKLKDNVYAKYVCTGVFGKIHKTDFVKDNGIQVFPTKYGEDIVFTVHEYSKTDNIKIIKDYVGYSWVYNQESVSNTSQKNMLDMLPFFMTLLGETKKYDKTKSPEYEYYIIQTVVFFLLWSGLSAKSKDFLQSYSEVFDWLYENYPSLNKNKYILLGPSGAPVLNRLSISALMIVHKLHLMPLFAKIYCKG